MTISSDSTIGPVSCSWKSDGASASRLIVSVLNAITEVGLAPAAISTSSIESTVMRIFSGTLSPKKPSLFTVTKLPLAPV
jgi:hypothetical protein